MNAHIVVWIYIILLVVGGLMGLIKGGSKIARPIPGDPCDGGEFGGKIG